jgi:hypothetical protein
MIVPLQQGFEYHASLVGETEAAFAASLSQVTVSLCLLIAHG